MFIHQIWWSSPLSIKLMFFFVFFHEIEEKKIYLVGAQNFYKKKKKIVGTKKIFSARDLLISTFDVLNT